MSIQIPSQLQAYLAYLFGQTGVQTPPIPNIVVPGLPSNQFVVLPSGQTGAITPGTTNSNAAAIFLANVGRGVQGPGWNAAAAGFGVGDQENWDNAFFAYYQLFVASASGVYLDRIGSNLGLSRPPEVGMSDANYRTLLIKQTAHKLTVEAFLEILQIFYGDDSVRAYALAALPEPYTISNGQTLNFTVDNKYPVICTFLSANFANPGSATAVEVSAAITAAMRKSGLSAGYAYSYKTPVTGLNVVKIASASLGLGSSIQITGGATQNVFRFPTLILSADTSAVWNVTIPSPGVARYTTSGTTTVDLSPIRVGYYVNIFGANFTGANQGSFPITNVVTTYVSGIYTQYFDVQNLLTVPQSGVVIAKTSDILWFNPTSETTTQAGNRQAIVSQDGQNQVDIILPATSQVVNRGIDTAAYMQPLNTQTVATGSGQRVGSGLVTLTVTNNLLVAGQQIYVDGFTSVAAAPVNAGNLSVPTGYTESSLMSGLMRVGAFSSGSLAGSRGVVLGNGKVFSCGGGTNPNTTDTIHTSLFNITGHTTSSDGSIATNYNVVAGPSMTYSRMMHQATTITAGPTIGRVLISGGSNSTFGPLAHCDIYDPVGNAIATTGDMTTTRYGHSAIALPDGRILVSGGSNTAGFLAPAGLATCEAYNTTSGTWASVASMNFGRCFHKSVYLSVGNTANAGKVMVIGGVSTTTGVPCVTVELYDPVGNSWAITGPLNIPRWGMGVAVLPNGHVLVFGGCTTATAVPGTDQASVNVESYDPFVGRWESIQTKLQAPVGIMSNGASYQYGDFNIVALNNGELLIPNAWTQVSGTYQKTSALTFNPNTYLSLNLYSINNGYQDICNLYGPLSDGTALLIGDQQNATNDSSLYIPAADFSGASGINGIQTISSATTTSIQFQTPQPYYALNTAPVTVTQFAEAPAVYPGPYIFNTKGGFQVTANNTTTTAVLSPNTNYTSVSVASSSKFPNATGYLVIGLGQTYQQGPIKYLGTINSTTLELDYTYKFTSTVPVGSDVTLLPSTAPYSINNPSHGSFWATMSASGRVAAEAALTESAAAGVNLNIVVRYPSDRGLGHEGFGTTATSGAVSDIVPVFAGDETLAQVIAAEEQ